MFIFIDIVYQKTDYLTALKTTLSFFLTMSTTSNRYHRRGRKRSHKDVDLREGGGKKKRRKYTKNNGNPKTKSKRLATSNPKGLLQDRQKFKCRWCHRRYTVENNAKQHEKKNHSKQFEKAKKDEELQRYQSDDYPVKCEECKMGWTNASGWKYHNDKYHKHKTWPCTYDGCDSVLSCKQVLKDHIETIHSS